MQIQVRRNDDGRWVWRFPETGEESIYCFLTRRGAVRYARYVARARESETEWRNVGAGG